MSAVIPVQDSTVRVFHAQSPLELWRVTCINILISLINLPDSGSLIQAQTRVSLCPVVPREIGRCHYGDLRVAMVPCYLFPHILWQVSLVWLIWFMLLTRKALYNVDFKSALQIKFNIIITIIRRGYHDNVFFCVCFFKLLTAKASGTSRFNPGG